MKNRHAVKTVTLCVCCKQHKHARWLILSTYNRGHVYQHIEKKKKENRMYVARVI